MPEEPTAKQIVSAIVDWINKGHMPPRHGSPVAQPIMQPIRYIPQPPALPNLPANILPLKKPEQGDL